MLLGFRIRLRLVAGLRGRLEAGGDGGGLVGEGGEEERHGDDEGVEEVPRVGHKGPVPAVARDKS